MPKKENEMEIPEKLAEEIVNAFKVMDINQFFPYQLERIIRWAIARIGKAYADGELKLPDEVGRGKATFGRAGVIVNGWIDTVLGGLDDYYRLDIIALSPEGTGKEEGER